MKKAIKQVIFLSLLVAIFASCKKDETKVSVESSKAPVLTATEYTSPMVLLRVNRNDQAMKLAWTNPDYQFSTGISSQDVSYTIQLDTIGTNFNGPNLKEQVISKDLGISLTVGQLNALMLNFKEDLPHHVQMRVKAALANDALPLYSNVIAFVATPYLDVVVPLPIGGHLYIIGSATPGSWDNPVPAAVQEFTAVTTTSYEITLPLTGGQEFLAIPSNGSWDNKYAADASHLPTQTGGIFGYNGANSTYGNNFPGPSTSGTYKIVFNFKTGLYTVTLQ
ncbi:MAG: SusE domain-containing protein [Ferruginibacter sp.]